MRFSAFSFVLCLLFRAEEVLTSDDGTAARLNFPMGAHKTDVENNIDYLRTKVRELEKELTILRMNGLVHGETRLFQDLGMEDPAVLVGATKVATNALSQISARKIQDEKMSKELATAKESERKCLKDKERLVYDMRSLHLEYEAVSGSLKEARAEGSAKGPEPSLLDVADVMVQWCGGRISDAWDLTTYTSRWLHVRLGLGLRLMSGRASQLVYPAMQEVAVGPVGELYERVRPTVSRVREKASAALHRASVKVLADAKAALATVRARCVKAALERGWSATDAQAAVEQVQASCATLLLLLLLLPMYRALWLVISSPHARLHLGALVLLGWILSSWWGEGTVIRDHASV